MSVRYAVKTDVGRIREGNEDSYLVNEPLFAVADGMGGHLAGEVASQLAVEVLTQDLATRGDGDRESLVNAVKHANSEIFSKSQGDASLSGMGTTCTLVFVSGGEARIAHVGDSRAYMWREGRLTLLTDDHTLVNRMVKEGRLRPEDAERHPQRSVITRALGIDSNVKVDYHTLDLQPEDRILICSDGLTSMIDASTVERVLTETSDTDAAAEELVRLANDAGGEDNITVVLIDVTDTQSSEAPIAAGRPIVRESFRTERATDEPVETSRPPRRWPKRLIGWLVALAVLGVGGFFVVDYLLSRAWYVGANEEGVVVIYQGIPEEVLGMDLKEEVVESAIALDELPDFLRDDVETGIKVDSEEEAEAKLDDLRARVRELRNAANDQQDQDKKKNN